MTTAVQNTKTKAENDYTAYFQETGEMLPGGAWLQDMRRKAIAKFDEVGLPHRRLEEWKYTDLRAKITEAYPWQVREHPAIDNNDLDKALGRLGQIEAHKLIFVNGAYSAELSDTIVDDIGVEILPLAEALNQAPAWFADELGHVAPFDENDPIVALNTAFMTDGAAIHIVAKGENKAVVKPIHLIFVSVGEQKKSNTTRYFVSVGKDVEVTLLETHVDVGETDVQNNCVCELIVGSEAKVDHIKCQEEDDKAVHLSTWMVRIGAHANYRAFQISTGAKLARNQILVRFQGEHAHANISGVFIGHGQQHNDTTLIVDHAVPHCSSQELFKVVLADDARGVFQGKLEVKQIAQKTDAKQMAQALLLSETAEFDAKPELEIFADDVICGHGATSGQIDEDLIFYLRARGISETEARSLLIKAFIEEVLEEIEDEGLHEALSEVTNNWLNKF